MSRPIKWHGLKNPPDYDIWTKRPAGTWDIMHSERDGWVIKPPWYWKTLREADKVVVGRVDREIARLRAEAMIRTQTSAGRYRLGPMNERGCYGRSNAIGAEPQPPAKGGSGMLVALGIMGAVAVAGYLYLRPSPEEKREWKKYEELDRKIAEALRSGKLKG